MEPRVFVIQDDHRRDFSKAATFGKLVPLIERDVFPDDADERVVTIRGIMKHILRDFNPLRDYLLLTGDPVAIVVATLLLSSMGVFEFRVLKWDKEHGGYFPVSVAV